MTTTTTIWASYSGTVHSDDRCSVLRPGRRGVTKPYAIDRQEAREGVAQGHLKDCQRCGGSRGRRVCTICALRMVTPIPTATMMDVSTDGTALESASGRAILVDLCDACSEEFGIGGDR